MTYASRVRNLTAKIVKRETQGTTIHIHTSIWPTSMYQSIVSFSQEFKPRNWEIYMTNMDRTNLNFYNKDACLAKQVKSRCKQFRLQQAVCILILIYGMNKTEPAAPYFIKQENNHIKSVNQSFQKLCPSSQFLNDIETIKQQVLSSLTHINK